MRFRGPLADSYLAAVGLVVCALIPFLCLTAAVFEVVPMIESSLQISGPGLDVTIALSDAGYALGTVLAVQFATHLPQRRMLLIYVTLFAISAFLAAWSPNKAIFIGAFITEGLCTSLMLIAAVPPLVTGWPVRKLPWTGGIMNLCIFGAVAIGPTIGGLEAASGHWRALFWGVFAVSVLAVAFALLTYEDTPAQDPSAPWDLLAIAMALLGCGACFYGAGKLQASGPSLGSLTPLIAGAALVLGLIVSQYKKKEPLMPVKALATVFPITGIIIALSASAASFGLMELALTALESSASPTTAALDFLPEFGAAVLTAGLFGVLFRTKWTPVLAFGGLVMICAAAAVLANIATGGAGIAAGGAALIGLGVGASVSPALFLAGFSLRSGQIQRVFAMIELMRGVTAFLIAPVLIYVASAIGASSAAGIRWTSYICLGIAGLGGLAALGVFRFAGGRLQTPDLEMWQKDAPAWESPALVDDDDGDAGTASGERATAEVA